MKEMRVVKGRVIRTGDNVSEKEMRDHSLFREVDIKDSEGKVTRINMLSIGFSMKKLFMSAGDDTEFYIYKSDDLNRSYLVALKINNEGRVSKKDLHNISEYYSKIKNSMYGYTFLLFMFFGIGFLLLPFTLMSTTKYSKLSRDLKSQELHDYLVKCEVVLPEAHAVI